MNKQERIKTLIREGVRTFDEIVNITGSKPSYVKSQFTKVGMDWKDYSPLKEEEVQEVSEEILEELEETKDLDPDLARMIYEAKELLEKARNSYQAGRLLHNTKLFMDVAQEVVDKVDISLKKQVQLNCQVSRMYPRPAPCNMYKNIYHLHNKLREIFTYYYKHCHGK